MPTFAFICPQPILYHSRSQNRVTAFASTMLACQRPRTCLDDRTLSSRSDGTGRALPPSHRLAMDTDQLDLVRQVAGDMMPVGRLA